MGRIKQDYVLVHRAIKDKTKKIWYYRLNGENLKSTGTSKKFEAEEIAKKAWSDKQKGNGIYEGIPTLKEYIEDKGFYIWGKCPHIANVNAEGKKPMTERYAYIKRKILVKYVLSAPFINKPITDITAADIAEWRNECVKHSVSSAGKALQIVKLIFRYARGARLIIDNPTDTIGSIREIVKNEVGRFREDELKVMFKDEDIIEPWETLTDKIMFMVAATTGMRRGEVLALTWNQIDFENNTINVDRAFKDTLAKITGKPKFNKERKYVPLPEITKKWLLKIKPEYKPSKVHKGVFKMYQSYLGKTLDKGIPKGYTAQTDLVSSLPKVLNAIIKNFYDDFVFKINGHHYNYREWLVAFNYGMDKMGLDRKERNIKPHSFRHTLNSILVGKGMSDLFIRETLGWSQKSTQQGYTHLNEKDTRKQATLIDDMMG